MKNFKFYIGERVNPQFNKSYFKIYGQLSKLDAKRKEDCVYGSMYLTSYDNEEKYNTEIARLKEAGFSIL